jgi:hypothetical protein
LTDNDQEQEQDRPTAQSMACQVTRLTGNDQERRAPQ